MIDDFHKYTITRLNKNHVKQAFSCGSVYLDNYLKTQASQDVKKNVSITYILTLCGSHTTIGYYTLSSIGIDAKDFPPETLKKLPKYPILPSILIGRLAVDKNHHGKKIGKHLLIDALKRSYTISTQVGIAIVTVDAKDATASSFYQYHGFMEFSENKSKLFLPMSTIKKLPFETKVREMLPL